jgi:hypothetical protein
MTLDLRSVDLDRLNSLTKYPSIPTYHALDPANGNLLDECLAFVGPVHGSEKVDGTNSRIVVVPGGRYVIGSREELLYAKGDLIGNPSLGIVDALREVADRLSTVDTEAIRVHYFEVYGGKVTAASKQYTGDRRVGYRLFDVAVLDDYATQLDRPTAQISAWREAGGQTFVTEDVLAELAARDHLSLTPRLFTVDAADLPTAVDKMRDFLRERLPATRSAIDEGAGGQAEGIVLRSGDRSVIAKARFQDYERTLRRRAR